MLTVVIASYKYGHLAAHCIESILSQSLQPDRILFVDDGAQDCQHLPSLYPSVDFVFRTQTLGTVANFQDMLMRIKPDSRALFIGADNWLRDDALALLDAQEADIVSYDIFVTGECKNEILNRHLCETYQGGFYWSRLNGHHGSILYPAGLAQRVGGYAKWPGAKRSEEDRTLYHRMVNAGATIAYIAEPLLFYRRHKENFNPC